MPQPPLPLDAVQFGPLSGFVVRITRSGGNLVLEDDEAGSLNLSQLAGLRSAEGVLIVGRGGAGAQYETVQAAVDAVPGTSSPANPHLILILPGVYEESVAVQKDGVTFKALGSVTLRAPAGLPALEVSASVSVTPETLTFEGIVFEQGDGGLACVRAYGGSGSTLAEGGFAFRGCTFDAEGVGSYALDLYALGNVTLEGCTGSGDATSSLRARQFGSLEVRGGSWVNLAAEYDSAGVLPSVTGGALTVEGATLSGSALLTFEGAPSSVSLRGTRVGGSVTFGGDRVHLARGCDLGAVVLNDTSSLVLSQSTFGALSGSGTADWDSLAGELEFAASASEAYVFPVPRTDAAYLLVFDEGVLGGAFVAARASTGFTAEFAAPQTLTLRWKAFAL